MTCVYILFNQKVSYALKLDNKKKMFENILVLLVSASQSYSTRSPHVVIISWTIFFE